MKQPLGSWNAVSGSDSSKGFDGSKDYSLSEGGYLFWEGWFGRFYSWIPSKLDWVASDYYNFKDLNRVENNTEIVADLISHFGVYPNIATVIDRDMKHIEFADSLNRIESNQDLLRQRYTPAGWLDNKLDWKSNGPFDFNVAARLESNLTLLYFYYRGNLDARPYCGMYTCGEGVI